MTLKNHINHKSLRNISNIRKDFKADNDSVSAVGYGSHVYYNSVNILTGAQGKHKTTEALSECALISQIPEAGAHVLLYFKKKEYDATLEGFREEIKCPIIEERFEKSEEFCKEFFNAKKVYNKLRRDGEANMIDELVEDPDEFKDFLHLPSEPRKGRLTTLVILEDAGNSSIFKNKDGYFNNLLKLLREIGAIVFICIHGFNQISAQLKENSAVFFIAKGLSDERVGLIHHQTNNGVEYKEFINAYHDMLAIPEASFLIVDCINGILDIE
jgi:hypothetical protein